MKQWLKKRKARGFTLVELLIVIVIIGILAGSLLLVMGSGTDKANATKIISDLRTIKAAALMYYADQSPLGWPNVPDLSEEEEDNVLLSYLDRVPKPPIDDAKYQVVSDSVRITGVEEGGIRDRLSGMARDAGLTSDDGGGTWYMDL